MRRLPLRLKISRVQRVVVVAAESAPTASTAKAATPCLPIPRRVAPSHPQHLHTASSAPPPYTVSLTGYTRAAFVDDRTSASIWITPRLTCVAERNWTVSCSCAILKPFSAAVVSAASLMRTMLTHPLAVSSSCCESDRATAACELAIRARPCGRCPGT